MSEKKEDWKAELRTIIKEEIQSAKVVAPPSSPPEKNVNPDHPTHNLEELLACPDCGPKVVSAVLKKEWEKRKDKEYECVDCGTRVDEDEDACPTCGGTEASHRR